MVWQDRIDTIPNNDVYNDDDNDQTSKGSDCVLSHFLHSALSASQHISSKSLAASIMNCLDTDGNEDYKMNVGSGRRDVTVGRECSVTGFMNLN